MIHYKKNKIGRVVVNNNSKDGYLEIVEVIDNGRVLIRCDGYVHNISIWTINRFKNTPTTMIEHEYIRYLNENIFNNTVLLAIRKIKSNSIKNESIVLVINKISNIEYVCKNPMKANINRILSKTNKRDIYRERVMKALGNKYDYSKTVCTSSNSTAIVTCPEHGDFEITVSNTIYKGCGCPKCSAGGFKYGKSGFVDLCNRKAKDGILYILKCHSKNGYSSDELFYKVGITTRSAMIRSWYIPYNTEIILSISGNPENIYNSESVIHKLLRDYSYTPNIKFKGETECFKFNSDEDIINFVKNTFNDVVQQKMRD